MSTIPVIPFSNSYARLPEGFFAPVRPTSVAAPRLIALNHRLARELGLDPEALMGPEAVDIFAGVHVPQGAEPLAMAYAGHQFGQFVPQLGDGRAILLGELRDQNGVNRDIQLKGAGLTPFSRRGDGRAALGPVLREYMVSEAMAALGIPTTRALAAVMTGETVWREKALPGAVLTRVAASHLRIGTFQFFAARGDENSVRRLADYAISRHYPQAASVPAPYLAFLEGVISRQAALVARWMLVGFVHGVMNTDNMSISGETIDYGPCAFMDNYNPSTVFSSIDTAGRYAYDRQSAIALWNLCRLAECLLPLLSEDEAEAVNLANIALSRFQKEFVKAHLDGLRQKLGLATAQEEDAALAQDLLNRMAACGADFTMTFRGLYDFFENPEADATVFNNFSDWTARWRARLAQEEVPSVIRREAMRRANPLFIPRNHRVEAALDQAINHDDFSGFETLLHIISKPYDNQPEFAAYALPPAVSAQPYRTFCGT